MKLKLTLILIAAPLFAIAQMGVAGTAGTNSPFSAPSYIETIDEEEVEEEEIGTNGYSFEVYDAGVNSEYSDYGSTFFMDKFIMFSSRKLGAFGNGKNKATNEPTFTLFCTDVDKSGTLSRPLLFSRFINNKENQGTVAFTPDEKTVYFTESSRENHTVFKLYKMQLDSEHLGHWINKEEVKFSSESYSVETPHVSADGKTLYFASNMSGTTGGFDIFSAPINEDGSLGTPSPVKGAVNTKFDEKYPYTSKSGKHLYFSSTGHRSLGGYDVFVSRIIKGEHKSPRNLGTTLNSRQDDISFIPASKTKGYLTSNRTTGKGGYDVYKTELYSVEQIINGKVLDIETHEPLSNAVIKLYDEEGIEIASTTTKEDASYKFKVDPYEIYTVAAVRDGFEPQEAKVNVYNGRTEKFSKNIMLAPTQSSIVEKDDHTIMIAVDNIYFDYNKSSIKKESSATLNKIAAILKAHPSINLSIEAHTDTQGDEKYNLNLSEERAASTKAYLASLGIEENRLMSKGYGKSKPLVNCKDCTEADHEKNRRIEFIIVDNKLM